MADAKKNLLGVQLTIYEKSKLLNLISENILANNKMTVVSGNIYSLNLAFRVTWFRNFLNEADAIRLDGAGMRVGARLLGYHTPVRMTWADFAWDLAAFAERSEFRLFFLGAQPGVADKAAGKLKERYQSLNVVGTHHGYFDKSPHSRENEKVIKQINSAKPNILIVGFGMPLQEKWLLENRDGLDANVILTGGAVFDYISGELRRAPRWMTDYGLEWLGRLFIEPRRLWKRYVIGNPLFFWRIFKHHFLKFPLPD